MVRRHLLLIDDEEDTLVLVRSLLASAGGGWTIDWAPSFEAGVEALSGSRHDAALLDYRLGAKTGVDLLRSVRDVVRLPPIVVLTGQGDRAVDVAAMATGAAGYLDKHALTSALLERTLRHAMDLVSRLREVQAALDLRARERVTFAAALAGLQPRETLELTASDITDAIASLPGIDIASLLAFEELGAVRILAVTAPVGYPVAPGDDLPAFRAAYLRERAAGGAWTESWTPNKADRGHAAALGITRLRAFASAPIMNGTEIIGLVALGTSDESVAGTIELQVPAAVDFAAAAGALITAPLAERRKHRESGRRIDLIVATNGFDPVFQPIVNLRTGAAIGFEALTRFRDGTAPLLLFEEASRSGRGLELEAATLARTIAASRRLPPATWLALNVSPALVLEHDRLARLLEGPTRPVVLEVTEHDAISDYEAVRSAIASLGGNIRVAVDDAGAGIANFGHIMELRPSFVKVDMSLVRGVDVDLTRQALIVGISHFAKATHGWVIAEGVETEEERQALIALDVTLAQGYLFGLPAAAGTWPSVRAPRSRLRRHAVSHPRSRPRAEPSMVGAGDATLLQ